MLITLMIALCGACDVYRGLKNNEEIRQSIQSELGVPCNVHTVEMEGELLVTIQLRAIPKLDKSAARAKVEQIARRKLPRARIAVVVPEGSSE